jgi:hypothetical protein
MHKPSPPIEDRRWLRYFINVRNLRGIARVFSQDVLQFRVTMTGVRARDVANSQKREEWADYVDSSPRRT